MATPDASLEVLLATVQRLERKLDAALRAPPKLLSKRAAAKMLGVDRGTTLEHWIREGRLRLVDGRVPLAELEQLVATGLPPARKRGPKTTTPPAVAEGDGIRRIELED